MSCQKFVTSLLSFQCMANLEQYRTRIPDGYFAKLIFSLIKTFYLTKTKNRTKKTTYMFVLTCQI